MFEHISITELALERVVWEFLGLSAAEALVFTKTWVYAVGLATGWFLRGIYRRRKILADR